MDNGASPHGPGAFVLCDQFRLVSGSGVSVKGEDALVVAAVPAAGVGDVGEPGMPERAGDQVADGCEGRWLVPGADFLLVLAESLFPHIVPAVLDTPAGAGIVCQVAGSDEVGGARLVML